MKLLYKTKHRKTTAHPRHTIKEFPNTPKQYKFTKY